MKREDLNRPVYIHICKDGTISYRRAGEPVFNGRALPVFSVDSEDQAHQIQVRFGRKQYIDHPELPGKPWYKWTDFDGNLDSLDAISESCREFYDEYLVANTK